MAMQATGKLDQARTYAQNIINGTKLSEKQREDFRKMSNELFNAAANQYISKQAEYAGIAKRNDLNVEDVVGTAPKLKESTKLGFPSQSDIDAEIARRQKRIP